jgi:spore germination cell wall hydrolase CwlJ-like protein
MIQPVVYRQPPVVHKPLALEPGPVLNQPVINSHPTVDITPAIETTTTELPAVAAVEKKQRKIKFKWLIPVILVAASAVYNVKQSQDIDYYKSTVGTLKNKSVQAAAVKVVDPAELRCMSENIYFEAGGESLVGKMAVGQVVLNRVRSPNYPKTVCGVVHQKSGDTCMFSWLCEGAKEIKNSLNWRQSQEVAYKLLSRDIEDITEGSTNFHGQSVNPRWNLKPTVRIDGHQFYR